MEKNISNITIKIFSYLEVEINNGYHLSQDVEEAWRCVKNVNGDALSAEKYYVRQVGLATAEFLGDFLHIFSAAFVLAISQISVFVPAISQISAFVP